MAENYSVEAYLKATGADQFTRAFADAGKSIEGVQKSAERYGGGMTDAIKKSGGFVDAQGRLRTATGQFMSEAEKAKHGLQGFGDQAQSAGKKSGAASITIGKMVGAIAATAVAAGAIRLLTSSLDGAISRYDTLNSFPRTLELLGFDAASSSKAVDKLSDGIDGLPTTLDSVAKTTQRIAGLTGDLDGAVDTTLALNNAFLASGASTGDASRGLDQYVQMLSKGEVDLQAWRTLQETMPVALNKTAEAFGYTGKSAQNDLYDALQAGDITFDQFNGKVIELSESVGGFADMAKESTGGIRTSWTNMKTAIVKGVADVIGAIDKGLGGVGSIAKIFDGLKSSISVAFAVIVAAVPPVLSALMQITDILQPWAPLIMGILTAFLSFYGILGMMNSLVIGFNLVKKAIIAMNTAMLANPVVLVIALLAGLGVALYMLYQRSETVRAGLDAVFSYIQQVVTQVIGVVSAYVMQVWGAMVAWWNANNTSIMATVMTVWNFIQTQIQTVVGAVVAFVMTIWAQLTAFWTQHGQMILQAAQNVWNVIKTVVTTAATVIWNVIQTMATIVSSVMQFLWPFIQALVQSVWGNIKGVIQGAISVITGIIQAFAALFTGNWSALWSAIKQIVSGAVKLVWNLVQLWFVGKILKLGTVLASGLRGIVTGLWSTVRSLFTSGVNAVRSVTTSGFNAVRSVVTTVMSAIRSVIQTILNAVRSTVTNVLNSIRNTFRNIFNALKNVVTTAFNGVKSAVRTGMTGALKVVTGFLGKFLSAGKNIVGSIADGIKSSIGKVTGAMGSIAGGIRNFLPFSPAKDGPLRDIMDIQVGQSIAKAIDKGRSSAVNSMASLASAVHSEMPNASIASDIGSLHQRSQRQMSYDYNNELSVSKQPANITIVLGNHEFERFVEDINEVNAVNDTLRRF